MRINDCQLAVWIALLAILLAGCDRSEPLKVGFVAGLSGRVADLGVAGRNGVVLAIEQANGRGGIDGRLVELVVRDDRQDRETAQKVVGELLAMQLEVIIGPMTSSMAAATVPLINASGSVMVSPTVTTTDLEKQDDQFIRVVATTRKYASKAARYQYERLGHQSAAAIYDLRNHAYTESWLRDFRGTFESLGGRLVDAHGFHSGDDAVFFKATQQLMAASPDVMVIISNAVDAAMICQQIRKQNSRVAIVSSEWGSTERFIELAGAASEKVHVAQFLNREDTSERYRTFRRDYMARFAQEPGFAGVAGYDAATVVLEAMTHRRKGQSFKQAVIDRGAFQGVQQMISIDRFGDAQRSIYLTVIKSGKYLRIE